MTGAYPWSVPASQLRFLTDTNLGALMRELLTAQAYRCKADVTRVRVNTEEKAGDEGCDGWTPAPPVPDPWLGATDTCWQFKAGVAGTASKLVKEVQKKIPVMTLNAGGRFVAVTSRAGAGKKDHADRMAALKKGAKKAKVGTASLEVLTSETLATWTNEHPAVAAVVRGMPTGWCSLKQWLGDTLHREPWHATAVIDARIDQLRKTLDFAAAGANHVHVYGPPGIGKTRFVMEVCRDAPWARSVIYIPQEVDAAVAGLIGSVGQAPGAQLVLIVDEVQPERVAGLNAHVRTASGHVKLVTIGPDGSPDSTTIEELNVEGLDDQTMSKVVQGWHVDLPKEHVQFVVSFAGGFVKLARLTANAVVRDRTLDTSQLMARNDIRQLLDAMLGKANRRRALHVLAVLSSVGWTGERAAEGQAIAEHLGLKWPEVQAEVEALHAKYGIAPRGGDLRYISPKPLGVYLALEAFEAFADKLRSLPDALPSDAARSAYYARLRSVIASPAARAFAEEELGRFTKWNHFVDPFAVERWAALAGADPAGAARAVRKAIEAASHDERLGIATAARRQLVRALVELAWHAEAFEDAALGLAELAEAENESWANNASGEFVSKFNLVLPGTARPYLERLEVIDELLARPVSYQRLAVSALARIGGGPEMRVGGSPSESGPAAPEWQAATPELRSECALAALDRLAKAASSATPELAEALLQATRSLAMLLRQEPVREAVAQFVRAAAQRLPQLREPLRLEVHRVLNGEKKYWKQLGTDDLAWLERFHGELEDKSPGGQLRQALAQPRWDRAPGDDGDLAPLATKLLADRTLLTTEWEWLTSGEAVAVWDLGEALGRADSDEILLAEMLTKGRGRPDLRLVAGYLLERAKQHPAGWVDDRIDDVERDLPNDTFLLFQLTWRCAPTDRGAERLARYARADRLQPAMLGHLVYGGWCLSPSIGAVLDLLRIVAEKPEFKTPALALVEQRLSKHAADLQVMEAVALSLVTTAELLRTGSTGGYSWAQVAQQLVPRHARRIARTIFESQAYRGDDRWFLEHTEAAKVLSSCVQVDPIGVWKELVPHLEAPEQFLFVIGFPSGIVSQLPHAAIVSWVQEDPERRASLLARMIEKVYADGTLGAKLLDRYRKLKGVGDTFFAALVSGAWTGPSSQHWELLASQLDVTVKTSKLAGVREWAKESATKLRRMAKQDLKREQEEQLRW